MVGLVAFLTLSRVAALPDAFADPAGRFALDVPTGWKSKSQMLEADLELIRFLPDPGNEDTEQVDVIVQDPHMEIPESSQDEVNHIMSGFVLQAVEAQGQVTRKTESTATFAGRKGLRYDLGFTDQKGVKWSGYLVAVCGKSHAYAITAYAKDGDTASFAKVDRAAKSLALESRSPLAVAGGGMLSSAVMKTLATGVKGGLQRRSAETVIEGGEPPLTYGSVANFVTVMELLFDIQLTEEEFAATEARFVEYYRKGDAKGKQILALEGAELLKSATQGTPEQIAQNRAEGKQVFENAFRKGAEMGIGYAQVMWDAISRRRAKVASVAGKPTKDEWDTEITEGDLDATMEMLYFMWVASGRDPSLVTQEGVIALRQEIIRELPSAPVQLQLVVANAPKVYAGMRQQWQKATDMEKLQLAQGYDQSLNSMGLMRDGSFRQKGVANDGTWKGDGSFGSNMAELAVNTAWNSAKTWTTTSN